MSTDFWYVRLISIRVWSSRLWSTVLGIFVAISHMYHEYVAQLFEKDKYGNCHKVVLHQYMRQKEET